MKILFKVKPKILIFISLVVSIVMIASAYFELSQNRKEVFHLLTETTQSLSETIAISSINALNSSKALENIIVERLLNNARLIRTLDSLNILNNDKLVKIAKRNNLFRINIFDKKGDRVFTNRVIEFDEHVHTEENVNRYKEVKPILKGETTELIIGLKKAMHVDEKRFAVAVARAKGRGAIVVNMNAKDYLKIRNNIGIGKFIHQMGDNSEIEYVVLQDSRGIIEMSDSVKKLSSFSEDIFLSKAILDDSTFSRVNKFDGREVFETIRGLYYDNEFIGVIRIGVTLDEVRSIEARTIRRIITISLILTVISIILLSVIISTQNLNLLTHEYEKEKIFTNSFLQNMKDAVINVSNEFKISMFNRSAEKLFSVSAFEVLGKEINKTGNKTLDVITENVKSVNTFKNFELSFESEGSIKFILINIITNFSFNKELNSHTIIISDVTKLKKMEEQTKRNEKLMAMGIFASRVAHEIRNPINSIGMIGQRLEREFKPAQNFEEHGTLTKLLSDEVIRINKIISQFLKYAKPLELNKLPVSIDKFMFRIYHLFIEQAEQKNIQFEINGEKNRSVNIDPELFEQAIINLIQNSFEAVDTGGEILVEYSIHDGDFIINVKDSGAGIPEKNKNMIFDLYFSTRDEGTGLGLAITQKIISQHNGVIDFLSDNTGTTFKIRIPLT